MLEQLVGSLDVERIQQHVIELTSDTYAGRAVGTVAYGLASHCRVVNLDMLGIG